MNLKSFKTMATANSETQKKKNGNQRFIKEKEAGLVNYSLFTSCNGSRSVDRKSNKKFHCNKKHSDKYRNNNKNNKV